MRMHEILRENDDEEEENEIEYPTIAEIEALKPAMAKAAQKVYDDWDESDTDTYAGGGICHYIADEIFNILSDAYRGKSEDAHKYTTVSSTHEQHVYCVCVATDKRGIDMVYNVDIPYGYYETGGGLSWEKIPDVEFTPNMVHVDVISTADDWENYIDEF